MALLIVKFESRRNISPSCKSMPRPSQAKARRRCSKFYPQLNQGRERCVPCKWGEQHEADAFHDGPVLVDEATNIRTGTAYLNALIDKRTTDGFRDPIAEAYKDYRGVRNGIYYTKISVAAEKLKADPESMQVLREMVK